MTHEQSYDSRIKLLDASRGIAALMVVLYHSDFLCSAARMKPFGSFFVFGDSGVDFFFVLSGFIMTWVHRKDWGIPRQLPDYLRRRFVRIYPTYWIATLICASPLIFLPWVRSSDLSSPWTFTLSNILLMPSTGHLIIPPAWTLQHEILFYIIFSTFIFNRILGALILTFWAAFILVANLTTEILEFPAKFLLNAVNLEFSVGIICALLVKRLRSRNGPLLLTLGSLLFFGAALGHVQLNCFSTGSVVYPLNFVLTKGLGAGLMIMGMVAIDMTGLYTSRRALNLLGTASYSIYLMHLPSMVLFLLFLIGSGLLQALDAEIVFILLAGYGIATGIGFHYVSERPLLHWLRS